MKTQSYYVHDANGYESGKDTISIYVMSSFENLLPVLTRVSHQAYATKGYDASEAVFTTQTRINIGIAVGVIASLACLGGGIGIGMYI